MPETNNLHHTKVVIAGEAVVADPRSTTKRMREASHQSADNNSNVAHQHIHHIRYRSSATNITVLPLQHRSLTAPFLTADKEDHYSDPTDPYPRHYNTTVHRNDNAGSAAEPSLHGGSTQQHQRHTTLAIQQHIRTK